MIDESKRPALAARFGWWWLDIAKAMLPTYLASPHCEQTKALEIPKGEKGPFTFFNIKPEWGKSVDKLPRKQQEEFCLHWYIEYYSEHAFRYELHARRGFTRNGCNTPANFQYGKPFHELTNRQIEMLVILHNTRQKNQPSVDTGCDQNKRPFAYTVSTLEDIANPQIIKAMRDKAKLGWTEPRLINFNLKQCADVDILKRLEGFLRIQRAILGIPNPHVNAGKKNAASKTGRPFTSIEALDVWTRLPRAEAVKTGYAEKTAREARKVIAELFGETNPVG